MLITFTQTVQYLEFWIKTVPLDIKLYDKVRQFLSNFVGDNDFKVS